MSQRSWFLVEKTTWTCRGVNECVGHDRPHRRVSGVEYTTQFLRSRLPWVKTHGYRPVSLTRQVPGNFSAPEWSAPRLRHPLLMYCSVFSDLIGMAFFSNLFGGPLQGPAAVLCRLMATENDRVMLSQIQEFADPVYWTGSQSAPKICSPHPQSLIMARLFGAASPLAVVKVMDPHSFKKVFRLVVKGCAVWTSNRTPVSLPEEEISEFLLDLIERFEIVLCSHDKANKEQAVWELIGLWVTAVILSWSGPSEESNHEGLLLSQGMGISLMIGRAVVHAASELGFRWDTAKLR